MILASNQNQGSLNSSKKIDIKRKKKKHFDKNKERKDNFFDIPKMYQ